MGAMHISVSDVTAASERLREHIQETPVATSRSVSERLGTEVHLKLENQQTTGSFKIRGSLNKMLNMSKEDLSRGVVASSAGNHAQGVAHAAQKVGAKAHIVMPET